MPQAAEVTLDIGTPPRSPRTSEEFEQIPHPSHSELPSTNRRSQWGYAVEEELPLHYMNEDKARRRLRPGGGGPHESEKLFEAPSDDEKDLFHNKARLAVAPRLPRLVKKYPPPSNLVRIPQCYPSVFRAYELILDLISV